jgi:prepilin-type N-terminal cleavage/methylation domain-containing protein
MKIKKIGGFSLIEILIAIAVLSIIAGVSVTSFFNWRSQKTIDSASDIAISVLGQARNLTVNAYQGKQYGVYVGKNDRLITFVGNSYNQIDPLNTITMLPTDKIISTSSPEAYVIFQKLTGLATGLNSFVISDKSDASIMRKIFIDSTGVISIQK